MPLSKRPEDFDASIASVLTEQEAERERAALHTEARHALEVQRALQAEMEREALRAEREARRVQELQARVQARQGVRNERGDALAMIASAKREDARRLDKRVVFVPLASQVYDTLYTELGPKDLEEFSEALYVLCTRKTNTREDQAQCAQEHPEVFYEFAHGAALGVRSWNELFQSEYEQSSFRAEWRLVPLVLMNRYDELNVWRSHCTLTTLALALREEETVCTTKS